jgi:Putative addiction module component
MRERWLYSPQGDYEMTSKLPFPPPGFEELTLEEQIEYAQELSDLVASRPEQGISVPDWHMEIVEERLARYGDKIEGISWEDFEKEILEQLFKH